MQLFLYARESSKERQSRHWTQSTISKPRRIEEPAFAQKLISMGLSTQLSRTHVEDLPKKASAPQGEDLIGQLLTSCLVFEAEDCYRVLFSIAELDSGIVDSDVTVADSLHGGAPSNQARATWVVAPRGKRADRWVRMLKINHCGSRFDFLNE